MTLPELIQGEIDTEGPLPFSRYMELALYHPELGFYARGRVGRRGDFITSPEVGPLFGAVVARALDRWWDELGQPDPFELVEAGAGPGTLARTILNAEPRCRPALRYLAVEPSESQRALHPVEVTSVPEMPEKVDIGVVLANELLDNLPFDLAEWSGSEWREVRLDACEGGLTEVLVPTDLAVETGSDPAPGCRVPVQRAAAQWLAHALSSVRRGRVVVIDYGVPSYPVEPDRRWLRTYRGHDRGADPLDAPGTRDITADVDLAALAAVRPPGEHRSQAEWLVAHGIEALVEEGREYWAEHVASPDLRALAMRSRGIEAEALLEPDGLGGFVVLEWAVGNR